MKHTWARLKLELALPDVLGCVSEALPPPSCFSRAHQYGNLVCRFGAERRWQNTTYLPGERAQ